MESFHATREVGRKPRRSRGRAQSNVSASLQSSHPRLTKVCPEWQHATQSSPFSFSFSASHYNNDCHILPPIVLFFPKKTLNGTIYFTLRRLFLLSSFPTPHTTPSTSRDNIKPTRQSQTLPADEFISAPVQNLSSTSFYIRETQSRIHR